MDLLSSSGGISPPAPPPTGGALLPPCPPPRKSIWGRASVAVFASALALASATRAEAAPEAHILRIDPRAGVDKGQPVLTVVTEVVQFNPLSQVLQPCASVTGTDRTLDCWS